MNMNTEHIHIRNIHEYMNNSYNESAYITLQDDTLLNVIYVWSPEAAPSSTLPSTGDGTSSPLIHGPSCRRRYL